MLECPICRRSYEGRFQVFVPPHHESFDTVECARRAAEAWGWDKAAPVPVILPTIEAVRARSETQVASAARRRGVAAFAGLELASSQAALATGVGLLAAGAAASIYLGFRPGETAPPLPLAAGAPNTPQTIGPRPAATRPAATGSPLTRTGSPLTRTGSPLTRTVSPRTRPAAPAVSRAKLVAFTDTGRSVGTASGNTAEAILASSPSSAALSTSPAESPVGSPTPAPKPKPKPKPSTPKAPPATSVTPQPPAPPSPPPAPLAPPVNPAGLAEAASGGGGGISAAGNPSPQAPPPAKPPPQSPPPQPPPAEKPPPQTPPPQTPPPQTPPPQTPPSRTTPPSDQSGPGDEDDDEHGDQCGDREQPSGTRPGNGWGDENHDHTGPPGQGNHGNGNGGWNGSGHDHDD
jgi:hypothetical protein